MKSTLHYNSRYYYTLKDPNDERVETLIRHSNHANEIDTDYVGAGTLGDIMSNEDLEQTNHTVAVDHGMLNSHIELEESSHIISPTKSGLVTQVGGTLQSQFGSKITNLSPLDRIALTSNGNLQRIFSSYYDAPVHVHVDSCVQRQPQPNLNDDDISSDAIWDRNVRLIVFDQVSVSHVFEVDSQDFALHIQTVDTSITYLDILHCDFRHPCSLTRLY
jgi:hypothetical protein